MASIGQIRGMLLEEALLHLLRHSGYRPVEHTGDDPTLENAHNGLNVKGRGGRHQIDAIADCLLYPPFSHPQRLLVEAKCTGMKTQLPVVRNALGVLKDVGEFWVSGSGNTTPTKRYHYQYALFSASGYTANAEQYAFAQDIYLIPLAGSVFLNPIVDSIRHISSEDFAEEPTNNIDVNMKSMRELARDMLKGRAHEPELLDDHVLARAGEKFRNYMKGCHRVDTALLAMLGGSFPVFLVPAPNVNVARLFSPVKVRIHYDTERWYLEKPDGEQLFSFDLPKQLFQMYAEGGRLTAQQALNMKEDRMSAFQAIYSPGRGRIKVISFQLDQGWLQGVREHLRG